MKNGSERILSIQSQKTQYPFITRSVINSIIHIIFFHPDFTVGSGISPDLPFGSRALPPVGTCTLP